MTELTKYILPLIGVIIGVILQYIFSKRSEFKKQQNLLKITAYTDLLKGLAGLAIFQKYKDSSKEMEYKMLVADAKSRICVYGDESVIKKISYLLKKGETIDSLDSYKALVDIIVEIRKQNTGSVNIDLNDFSQLLIGTNIE